MPLETILKNGDMIKIITSKKESPSLHWLSTSKTGKARAAIRRYWQNRSNAVSQNKPKYTIALF